jgi:ribonuclease P protein component
MLLSVAQNQAETDRIGCTISRKVGKAVVRNRLKRWVREYFRTHGNVLAFGLDVNVVLIPNKNSREFFKTLPHGKIDESLQSNWKMARARFQRGGSPHA